MQREEPQQCRNCKSMYDGLTTSIDDHLQHFRFNVDGEKLQIVTKVPKRWCPKCVNHFREQTQTQ